MSLPPLKLEPLPKVPCPAWLSDDLKASHPDVLRALSIAQKFRDDAQAKVDKIRTSLDLMDAKMPTTDERQKGRIKILQAELQARQMAEDFFHAAEGESRAELSRRQPLIADAKMEARRRLFAAGFKDFDPAKPFITQTEWLEDCDVVKDARRDSSDVRDYLGGSVHDEKRFNFARLGSVRQALEEIRSSMALECASI